MPDRHGRSPDGERGAGSRGRPDAPRAAQRPEPLAGRNAVREALRANRRRIRRVRIAEGAREQGALGEIIALAAERGIPVERVPRAALDAAVGHDELTHQGVLADAGDYPYVGPEDILAEASRRGEPAFLLALDSLQDPQNVGALLRTAEAVGVHGVLIPRHRAAGVTAAVSRASAGAVEHMLVAEVTNLTRALQDLKVAGVWAVGLENDPAAEDYTTADLSMPLVLVAGSEGQGMHRLVRETCDLLVRLPMRGRVESLNVAVAGSVLLYRVLAVRGASGRAS